MNDTLANTEKKTAYILTLPAVLLVFSIILFPIFANVWISFKEGELKDIRIHEPRAKKIINAQFLNRITREYIDDQISVDEAVDKINAELAKF